MKDDGRIPRIKDTDMAGPSTPPIMGRCRDLRAGWRFSSVTAG